MFIFTIILCAMANNNSDPAFFISRYKELIPHTFYSLFTNQTLTLTYDAYVGVYSMKLQVKPDDLIYKNQENFDFTLFNDINEASACKPIQRIIEQQNSLSIGLPTQETKYFTDFISIPQYNKVYAVRNDFNIFQIKIELNQEQDHISSISLNEAHQYSFQNLLSNSSKLIPLETNHPFIVYNNQTEMIYVITTSGAIRFSANSTIEKQGFQAIKQTELIERKRIEDVIFNSFHNAIFISAGIDGIDIYKIDNNENLRFFKNYNGNNCQIESLNAVDIALDESGKLLYILNSASGFNIIDITNLKYPVNKHFFMPLLDGVAFDFWHDTFIFIARNQNFEDYAIEVFIDIKRKTYYINRIYQDQMHLFDVAMFEHYAVLIGYDAHKLIYHSIFQGFVDPTIEHYTIFREPELQKIERYDLGIDPNKQQLIGLGEFELKTFQVITLKPRISCHSDHVLNQVYLLQMNSTNCNKKSSKLDYSQFSQCNISHPFTISVDKVATLNNKKQVFLTTKYKKWIIAGAIIVGIILICLFITFFICQYRWKKYLVVIEERIRSLKNPNTYDGVYDRDQLASKSKVLNTNDENI